MCSGANMDFDRLRFVSERADSSETLISATIPERPGAFQVRRYNIGVSCLSCLLLDHAFLTLALCEGFFFSIVCS